MQQLRLEFTESFFTKTVKEHGDSVVVALLEGTVKIKKVHSLFGCQPAAESRLATVHISHQIILQCINSLAVCKAAGVGGSLLSMVATSVTRSAGASSLMRDTVRSLTVSL